MSSTYKYKYITTKSYMHNICICTISSPVPIRAHNTVQVPWRPLTGEGKCQSFMRRKAQLSSPPWLCHILDSACWFRFASDFFTCGQTSRKAFDITAKKSHHRVIVGSRCSVTRAALKWESQPLLRLSRWCSWTSWVVPLAPPRCLQWR